MYHLRRDNLRRTVKRTVVLISILGVLTSIELLLLILD